MEGNKRDTFEYCDMVGWRDLAGLSREDQKILVCLQRAFGRGPFRVAAVFDPAGVGMEGYQRIALMDMNHEPISPFPEGCAQGANLVSAKYLRSAGLDDAAMQEALVDYQIENDEKPVSEPTTNKWVN